jgi:hypothetical protein
MPRTRTPVADLVSTALGRPPIRVQAYDGSTAGPADSDIRR